MDVTTLSLAVDSTQVNGASAALDRMAAAGGKVEGASSRMEKAFASVLAEMRGIGQGVQELVRLAAASNTAAAAAAKIAPKLEATAQAGGAASKAIKDAAGSARALGNTAGDLRGLAAELNRVTDAGKATAAQIAATKAAVQAVNAASVGSGAGVATTTRTTTTAAAAARQLRNETNELAKAAKVAAFQHQQLGFQIHDFIVQVASGQSPLTAFVQQGSQLSGTFGGAGNAFRAVIGLLTPMRIAIGGAAAAIAGLGVALYEGSKQNRAFADALTISGNFAGQTDGQFRALARSVADTTNATISEAREFTAALVRTGEIGPQVFASAAQAAVAYGKATGKTADEVAKDFADMARSPSKFAAEANRSLNFITAAQYASIKAFEDAGKAADAQGVIYDALNKRLTGLDGNLGWLDRQLVEHAKFWSAFWNAAFDVDRPQTIEEKIADTARKLSALQNPAFIAASGGFATGFRPGQTNTGIQQQRQALEAERTNLFRQQLRQSENAFAEADRAATEKRRLSAIDAVEGYKKQAKGLELVNDELKKARANFAALKGTAQEVPAAEQKRIEDDIRRRFAAPKGPKNTEGDQVRRAQLDSDLKAFQDVLQREKDAIAFHNRFLQGEYQAGALSLRQFFDDRRATTEKGVAAEIAELDKEKARLEQFIGETKDPSEKVQARTRINEIGAEQAKIRTNAANEVKLANQEEAASFKALADQVVNFRANLLQLQGDEVGAAKLRAQQALESARILSRQSGGAITDADIQRQNALTIAAAEFNDVQSRVGQLFAAASNAEEAYYLTATQGSKSLLEQERDVYAIRSLQLERLGTLVAKANELAAASTDPRIKAFAADLALQYARAADAVNPALNRLREASKGAADGIAEDIGNAVSGLSDFNDLAKNIGNTIRQTFAKLFVIDPLKVTLENAFKSITEGDNIFGQFIRDSIGLPIEAAKPVIDTSAVTQSLTNLQAAGIDPTANALVRLQQAADGAASSLGGGAPGTTGEQSTFALFKDAANAQGAVSSSIETFGKSATAATSDIAGLAQAAGAGNEALSALPRIISMISSAASAVGGGSSGIGGFFSGLFGGVPSNGTSTDDIISMLFHDGGIVGSGGDPRSVSSSVFDRARRYHGGGLAGLAPNEVPAILMGGPKGVREEVLTASDWRHRDNLDAQMRAAAQDQGNTDRQTAPVININVNVPAHTDQRSARQIAAMIGDEVNRAQARYR